MSSVYLELSFEILSTVFSAFLSSLVMMSLIDDVLTKRHEGTIARVKRQVRELTEQVPPYAGRGFGGANVSQTGEILR